MISLCNNTGVYAVVNVWKPMDKLGCLPSLSTLFETEHLILCCLCQLSWPKSFQELSCLHLPLLHRPLQMPEAVWLYIGSGSPCSGP